MLVEHHDRGEGRAGGEHRPRGRRRRWLPPPPRPSRTAIGPPTSPCARSPATRRSAVRIEGVTTIACPRVAAATARRIGSVVGATWSRWTPGPYLSGRSLLAGRGLTAGGLATILSGEAARRIVASRPAHRHATQRHRSIVAASGPTPDTFATSARPVPAGGSLSSSVIQPATRRPARGTRTMAPTRTRSPRSSGTE